MTIREEILNSRIFKLDEDKPIGIMELTEQKALSLQDYHSYDTQPLLDMITDLADEIELMMRDPIESRLFLFEQGIIENLERYGLTKRDLGKQGQELIRRMKNKNFMVVQVLAFSWMFQGRLFQQV